MNIILTGSSGFIGQNFINRTSEYNIVPVSLRNTLMETIDFKDIDTVLHLAGLVHQMKGAPEEEYFRVNSDLTFELAKKAKEKRVKHFVFISTAKVYGESSKIGKTFDEKFICSPLDPYSKSKLQAEEKLKSLEDINFKVAIVRIPLVYGAGVKGNLNNLMNLITKISFIPLGKINNKRSLLYVGNLIDILKKIINQQRSGIFIACDNTSLSTSELIQLIAQSLNKKIVLFEMPAFIRKTIAKLKPGIIDRLFGSFELNNTFTNQTLEFAPKYSIETGMNEMVEHYINNRK